MMPNPSAALGALLGPARRAIPTQRGGPAAGIAAGARVMTADGMIPVEFLSPGDAIVTRAGLRLLRRLDVTDHVDLSPFRITPSALGHGRPHHALTLGAETRLHLRDWRAPALYGAAAALVRVARLGDGRHVSRPRRAARQRLFAPIFDTVEIFYAEGVEIASTL